LTADELAQPLQPALKRAEDEVFKWALNIDDDVPGRQKKTPVARGSRRVGSKADLDLAVRELRSFEAEHEGSSFVVEWRTET
jgi:hypothetical protein